MRPSPPLLSESTTTASIRGTVIIVLVTIKAKVQGPDKAPPKQLELHVVEGN